MIKEYFSIRKKYIRAKTLHKEIKRMYPDEWRPPFISLTEKEAKWLNEAHDLFYGKPWYVVDPLSGSQVNFIKFYNIKDKIRNTIIMPAVMICAFLGFIIFKL